MSQIHISLSAEVIGHVFGFPITNSMLAMLAAAAILIFGAWRLKSQLKIKPSRSQALAELGLEAFMGLMDSVTQNRQLSKRFLPMVGTLFLFILTMNWMGLLPIFGTIGFHATEHGEKVLIPFLRAGTADLNLTLALALVSVIATQVFGVVLIGWKKYGGRFFVLKKNPVYTFVGLLEFISEFTKVISFSFRLFGNVFAGEVLLVVIATLVPFIAPVPFYFLELFVGFIQAFVFALLSLVFFTIAATSHEPEAAH